MAVKKAMLFSADRGNALETEQNNLNEVGNSNGNVSRVPSWYNCAKSLHSMNGETGGLPVKQLKK